jgi:succinate dehydrogenase / fumarate reductase flavoprotein subunit
MQSIMMSRIGIYRNGKDMGQAVKDLKELRSRCAEIQVADTSRAFNTELMEAFELTNLLDLALITAASALNREESRGAHSREDFPDRDDENWLKHTLARLEKTDVRVGYKPVDTSRWEPKPRAY